jgi:sugar phosphate isomerase/epimerase
MAHDHGHDHGHNHHSPENPKVPKYWHTMDKEWGPEQAQKITLGISTPPMQDQLQSIQARIKQGATAVELGFMGTGKGSAGQGAFTPGTLGIPEREAIRDVAKVNDVTISSVHASMKIQGLAGFGSQGFNEAKRAQDMEEVKRTIDFAGDVTDGGAIVVHTGEFPYSVREKHGKTPFKTKEGKPIEFTEGYSIAQQSPRYLVDMNSGKIMSTITPDFKTVGLKSKDGKLIQEPKNYDNFVKMAQENMEDENLMSQNKEEYIDRLKARKSDKKFTDNDYKNTYGDPGWVALHWQNKQGVTQDTASLEYYKNKKEGEENTLNLLKAQLKANETLYRKQGVLVPEGQAQRTIDDIKYKINRIEREINSDEQFLMRHELNDAQRWEQLDNIRPIEVYGINKTSESIAELAIDAAGTTRDKNLKSPLFVAPENLWDGNYGAHPEDLRKIIVDSRKKAVEFMTKDKIEMNGKEIDNPFREKVKKALGHIPSESEAKKLAENHIKATFDIGHANIWKKYFSGDEKEFNSWLGHEVDKLTKDKIIGHVHVSDNFGYNDEHLPPGYGNAPIKEFLAHMQESGFEKEFIVEPAHHDVGALISGMEHLNMPVYRINNQTEAWTSPNRSYFGQTYIPSFVTPAYLPPATGEEGPMVWSGLPLE